MSYFIIDIETVPNRELTDVFTDGITAPKSYKDPDKIHAYIREKEANARKEMSLDPDFCEILCIGIKEEGKDGVLMTIEEFAQWLKGYYTTEDGGKVYNLHRKMVTFNGKQFDIPIILREGIRKGIDLPYRELMQQCSKYNAKNHIDLMQELATGYNEFKSLDKYLQIYLNISKTPIDFETASEEKVRRHCLEDISNTEKLFNKFAPFFTWVNPKPNADVPNTMLV